MYYLYVCVGKHWRLHFKRRRRKRSGWLRGRLRQLLLLWRNI